MDPILRTWQPWLLPVDCVIMRHVFLCRTVSPAIQTQNVLLMRDMEWNYEKTVAFINDYHNSGELWDIKIPNYKDNKIKNDKLKELSEKYNCTILDLKKKIKNLRSAFHREHKKLGGKKSGSSSNKKSKWFAYELLKFLLHVDAYKTTSSTAGSDEEDLEVARSNDVIHPAPVPSPSSLSASRSSKKLFKSPLKVHRKRKVEHNQADEVHRVCKDSVKCRDASTVFGEYVAMKHRHFSSYTKVVVEHAINTILFDADMGKYDNPSTSQQLTVVKVEPESQMVDSDLMSYYSSSSDESSSIQ